jgi:hypothetical protein
VGRSIARLSPEKAATEKLLKAALLAHLDRLAEGEDAFSS